MIQRPNPYFAYVGSRTTRERNARGAGMTVYRVIPDAVDWEPVQVLSDLVNPSFLALDRSNRHLYAVHGDQTEISAFRIDPITGKLEFNNRVATGGKNPVHLAIDPTNRFIVVANHLTSTLAVLPIGAHGELGAPCDLVTLSGAIGPHRTEQPFAKPHQVVFDRSGRFIAVPDKGLDRVFVFRFDAEDGKLAAVTTATMATREAAGPRHIAFHPDNGFAYVVNELDSTVNACRFDAASGRLQPFQVLSSLPDTWVANNRAAEIETSADGRFVYVSNRGHDSIGAFAVAPASGRLNPVGWQPCCGKTPRFFALSPEGRSLIIANEESDDIWQLPVDTASGALEHGRMVARTGSPVCIVFGGRANSTG